MGLVFVTNHFIYSIAEEVVKITTSSAIQQTDSFSIRYLKAKKYYDSKNYTHALRIYLDLLHEKSLTLKQLIEINQFIADIYFESRNSKDAIIYYKKALN